MILPFALIICFKLVTCNPDVNYWREIAERDMVNAMNHKINNKVAKNVILFVGDGLDLNTVTASRIYKFGEGQYLSFDKFPNLGLLKTYSADKLVPDSSSTATALFCGVKANYRTAGVDASVRMDDCEATLNSKVRLQCILDWAQAGGKSTGFVTTTRVTHATPSALYAHTASRKWECEDKMLGKEKFCKDIGRQLVEDEPGRNINVIFGGGRQCLQSNVTGSYLDPTDAWSCSRKDGKNLILEWALDKKIRKLRHAVLKNRRDLQQPHLEMNEFVLGIFANSHLYLRNDNGTLNVREDRGQGPLDQPTLSEMTEAAIKILRKNKKGFVLMVEGGLIDYAHHRGRARAALDETIEFSKAIKTAVDLTKLQSEETLIIVTSDHTHSLVFSGYPNRTQGVLGVAQKSRYDNNAYTTLLYGNGGPNNYQYQVLNGQVHRIDPRYQNTSSYNYSQQTGVLTDEVTHGGADVVIYAKGPMSHLFQNVHEQTYVPFVIGYAAKIGPYANVTSAGETTVSHQICVVTSIIIAVHEFLFF